MSDGVPVMTVAVCNSDGSVYHLDRFRAGKYPSLKKLPVFTGNPDNDNRWRHLIKQLKKHRKPCKMRLIVGWDGSEPILDELTYRPKERQLTTVTPPTVSDTPPLPRRLR